MSASVHLTAYVQRGSDEGFELSTAKALPTLTESDLVVVIGAKVPWRRAIASLHDLGDAIEHGQLDGPADRFVVNADDAERIAAILPRVLARVSRLCRRAA
jgi:hypothetical protein